MSIQHLNGNITIPIIITQTIYYACSLIFGSLSFLLTHHSILKGLAQTFILTLSQT